MFRRSRVSRAAALAVGGFAVLATGAWAQGDQRVEVTGSMLRRTDAETAEQLRVDDDCRGFVGLDVADPSPSAADCATARRLVLGILGFGEYLCVLLELLERRGLLADARFAPDAGLLQPAPAAGVTRVPQPDVSRPVDND